MDHDYEPDAEPTRWRPFPLCRICGQPKKWHDA